MFSSEVWLSRGVSPHSNQVVFGFVFKVSKHADDSGGEDPAARIFTDVIKYVFLSGVKKKNLFHLESTHSSIHEFNLTTVVICCRLGSYKCLPAASTGFLKQITAQQQRENVGEYDSANN